MQLPSKATRPSQASSGDISVYVRCAVSGLHIIRQSTMWALDTASKGFVIGGVVRDVMLCHRYSLTALTMELLEAIDSSFTLFFDLPSVSS